MLRFNEEAKVRKFFEIFEKLELNEKELFLEKISSIIRKKINGRYIVINESQGWNKSLKEETGFQYLSKTTRGKRGLSNVICNFVKLSLTRGWEISVVGKGFNNVTVRSSWLLNLAYRITSDEETKFLEGLYEEEISKHIVWVFDDIKELKKSLGKSVSVDMEKARDLLKFEKVVMIVVRSDKFNKGTIIRKFGTSEDEQSLMRDCVLLDKRLSSNISLNTVVTY